MKAEQLSIGTKVQIDNGATAEVVDVDVAAHQVRVRYLDSPFQPEHVGTEEMCWEDQITGFYHGDDLSHTSGQLV